VPDPLLWLYLSISLVSLIALLGVVTLSLDRDRLHAVVDYLVSLSAGTMFGGTFLHLLPETAEEFGFTVTTGLAVLSGLVLAFVVEKYIAWHHHHHPGAAGPEPMAYMILLGDAVHNVIDGIIIAASYLVSVPLGIATTVAIGFHEIPQELGDFGVLVYGGMSRTRAVLFNFGTALTAFVGATAVVFLVDDVDGMLQVLVPLAAGNFIYIAGSDLLPELVAETDVRRSSLQMGTFLVGLGVMYLLAH
jgi:zinc and cadmium transporter